MVESLVSCLLAYERLPAARRLDALRDSHALTFDAGALTPAQVEKLESVFLKGGPEAVSIMSNLFGFRGMTGSLPKMQKARDSLAAREKQGTGSRRRESEELANLNAKIAMLEEVAAEKAEFALEPAPKQEAEKMPAKQETGIAHEPSGHSAGRESGRLTFVRLLNVPATELCKMGEELALELKTVEQAEDLATILKVLTNNYGAYGAKYSNREYDKVRPSLLAFFGALFATINPDFADRSNPKLKDRQPVPRELIGMLGENADRFISHVMKDLNLHPGDRGSLF